MASTLKCAKHGCDGTMTFGGASRSERTQASELEMLEMVAERVGWTWRFGQWFCRDCSHG
jgi:hypothetical protein